MKVYKNGNYIVKFDEVTGTKIYQTFKSFEPYNPDFPDSLDVKITNKCQTGCPFCFENSTRDGKHADLDKLWNILNRLPNKPIEIALGGGDILEFLSDSTPEIQLSFTRFLQRLKSKGFSIGMTLELGRFLDNKDCCTSILNTPDLINSLGLSISNTKLFKNNPPLHILHQIHNYHLDYVRYLNYPPQSIVFHAIVGIITVSFLRDFIEWYNEFEKTDGNSDFLLLFPDSTMRKIRRKPRIIFLGYKSWGRGKNFINPEVNKNIEDLRVFLNHKFLRRRDSKDEKWNISFDNLAIEQLGIRNQLTTDQWNSFFMGEEMSHSMYVDGVSEKFAQSSHSYPISDWKDYNYNILKFFNENKQPHDKS